MYIYAHPYMYYMYTLCIYILSVLFLKRSQANTGINCIYMLLYQPIYNPADSKLLQKLKT